MFFFFECRTKFRCIKIGINKYFWVVILTKGAFGMSEKWDYETGRSRRKLLTLKELARVFAFSISRWHQSLPYSLQISTYGREDREGLSANGRTPPSRWGTPAVAFTLAVHGCAAPAASGVNERAAVRSNTAHAPAHFTPALIDRCPSGPLSFTPSFSFLCLPFLRTCVRSPPRVRVRGAHGTAVNVVETSSRTAEDRGTAAACAKARWRLRGAVLRYRLMVRD